MDRTERKVEKVLEKVRPYIALHGGDVRIGECKGGTVVLRVSGACVGCPLAELTYSKTVGALIKKTVPAIRRVVFEELS